MTIPQSVRSANLKTLILVIMGVVVVGIPVHRSQERIVGARALRTRREAWHDIDGYSQETVCVVSASEMSNE